MIISSIVLNSDTLQGSFVSARLGADEKGNLRAVDLYAAKLTKASATAETLRAMLHCAAAWWFFWCRRSLANRMVSAAGDGWSALK